MKEEKEEDLGPDLRVSKFIDWEMKACKEVPNTVT